MSVISDAKSNVDHYTSLKSLPEVVANTHVRNLEPYTAFILSCLWKDQVFFILPKNELMPLSPRDLPREFFADEVPAVHAESSLEKKKGRPGRRDKSRKARAALKELEEWIGKHQQDPSLDPLYEYRTAKSAMMDVLTPETDVDGLVLERLKMAQELIPMNEREADVNVGIPRVEKAIECGEWGILSLLR